MKKFTKVSVIGLGYIGLPTAAMFAERGLDVIGIDVRHDVVSTINNGKIHIVEPGLEAAVAGSVMAGKLRASAIPEPADAFVIAVPTPFKGEDHIPDLSYVKSAAQSIAGVLKPGDLVVLESTSPVGATERLAGWLARERPDLTFPQTHKLSSDVRIAHCPERVLPGKVLQELITNDRIIGGMTPLCSELAVNLYQTFVKGECVVASSSRAAEMSKLAENSFRDLNIAFANQLSLICDELSIDVWELISVANRHPRVNILSPGPGVGGHCIAVDPWFLISASPENSTLLQESRRVNDAKIDWVVAKITDKIESLRRSSLSSANVNVSILGLAYKPDVDDLRESPSLVIASRLSELSGCRLTAVEPNVKQSTIDGIAVTSIETALASDLLVKLVAHREFIGLKDQVSGVWMSFVD